MRKAPHVKKRVYFSSKIRMLRGEMSMLAPMASERNRIGVNGSNSVTVHNDAKVVPMSQGVA